MLGFGFAFDSPWFLLLLVLLPLLWVFSFKSLSGLGPYRRLFSLGLRSAVLLLLILSLAETQYERKSDKLTVMYLLDQSLSIPINQREAMLKYVVEDARMHRKAGREDRAGMIAFGREAAIEVPPFDDELATTGRIESLLELRQDATDLSAAMRLALATFPEDSAKRVVIVTDGNENMGDAREMASVLAQRGVSIYVVPVTIHRQGEVAIEKVTIPSDVRKGQPFDVRIVANNIADPDSDNEGTVKCKLQLLRKSGQHVVPYEQAIELPPGKKVFKLPQEIDNPDFYTYEAILVPDRSEDDLLTQNNRAAAFTHIRGHGHVLFIEDWDNRGEFDVLVARLKKMNLEITVQGSDQLFSSLVELQRYDTVVLANVPRSSGADANTLTNFSDTQIDILVRNVQKMGSGLVMIGGSNSFGAGGWSNTELEKAMPVDFQIHNAKVVPVGALVLQMHASEMAQGNYWQKEIAEEALKALGPQDYCGVIHYGGTDGDTWLWNNPNGLLKISGNRKAMLARLNRMTPGDMPAFDPGMKLAAFGFAKVADAGVRHMIIISDGDPSPPNPSTISALRKQKAKVTTVAVGTHGAPGSTILQRIATQTGGKYYVVTNPRALPRIYQKEARRVARPLVKEKRVQPQIIYRHEMLRGIDTVPPPLTGFVLTTVKENPLVEVSIISPDPPTQKNATILASWTYGLGRTVAFTTDAGRRWANEWSEWDYDKFFSQMVNWSMRPVAEEGKFSVATDVKDGTVRVVVTALDKDNELLNFLSISGSAVDPEMESVDFLIEQTAAGRYVGEFDATKAGSYLLTLTAPNPDSEDGDTRPVTIRTGVNVPYSSEFRDRETNVALLNSLAKETPQGGQPGKYIAGSLTPEGVHELLTTDTFYHDLAKAVSSQDIWNWLVLLASCVFLGDVFVRRVAVHFYWVAPLIADVRDRLWHREQVPVVDQRLERLRSRKETIGAQIDERRASTRFEPAPDADVEGDLLAGEAASATQQSTRAGSSSGVSAEAEKTEETYTERLLKVKKRIQDDRKK